MKVDAHLHYWQLSQGFYDWLGPELSGIYRDFLPSDLTPILQAQKIDATIVVQAAPTERETYFIFELAKAYPSISGVVGWVDMEASDAIDRLDRMIAAGDGLLKGIRPMIQEISDVDWMLSPSLDPVFRALEARQIVFDALILPIHLKNLNTLAQRYPGLTMVVDHAAKPPRGEASRVSWSADLHRIAQHPNAYCKLSGLMTQARSDSKTSDALWLMAEIFKHFTPDRVIWGSDWPVLNLASDYETWMAIAAGYCARFSPAEQKAIFGDTAIECYGLRPSAAPA